MIELSRASRWYGQVIGLNDVSCAIEPGITALLGENGAGKTTIIKLITGQIKPTTGEVRVFGMRPFANPEVYRILGYCPEIDSLYERMTGRAFVLAMARMFGMAADRAKARTEEVLDLVKMSDRADRRIAGYSKGMRQRIKLAQAMLNDPKVILLDEPLNGLDPGGRREYMEIVDHLAKEGRTIVVCSHILYEVEQITRNILLLHRGRLLATGDVRVIRGLIDKHPHRIRIETDDPRRVAAQLLGLPYVISLRFEPSGDALEIESREPDRFYESFPRLVIEHELPVRSYASPDNNLESVFRYLVSK